MNKIPFIHELDVKTGKLETISPLVRRIICPNPGPYTYTGTGTYIIGHGEVAVIDPGPINKSHLKAILDATKNEKISHILVSHTHADHSPLAKELHEASGAKIYGCAPHPKTSNGTNEIAKNGEEGVDYDFSPHHELSDGDEIKGNGWTIKTIHTPGHTSNHLCFNLKEEQTLFSGDHIMAWSTSIIIPPDGSMAKYMESLERLMAMDFKYIRPTHGPAIIEPSQFIEALLAHRMEREALVINAVALGHKKVSDIVNTVYIGLPKELHKAAGMSCLAHLILLVNDGRIKCDNEPNLNSEFYINPDL